MNLNRGVIVLLSVFFFPFISAQFLGGYSFSDIFNSIDPQSILILVVFGFLAILLNAIFNRMPALSGGAGRAMSIIISLGATYGINRWVNLNDLLIGTGFGGDLTLYLPLILLIIFVIALF
ncbi:MAG: hypothetical protein WD876_00180, partial [Candidatus Pacearchaeota archaeon]